jgi:hypothetical protein
MSSLPAVGNFGLGTLKVSNLCEKKKHYADRTLYKQKDAMECCKQDSLLLLHEKTVDDHEADFTQHHDEGVAHFQPYGPVLPVLVDLGMLQVGELRVGLIRFTILSYKLSRPHTHHSIGPAEPGEKHRGLMHGYMC